MRLLFIVVNMFVELALRMSLNTQVMFNAYICKWVIVEVIESQHGLGSNPVCIAEHQANSLCGCDSSPPCKWCGSPRSIGHLKICGQQYA